MDSPLTEEHNQDANYPRPQLRRAHWITLDGEWQFAFDDKAQLTDPSQVEWNLRIRVPFAPETPASGIGNTGIYCAVWYRREFTSPELQPGERLVLHFGAVDFAARVWVNGVKAGEHEGGYTPFSLEITHLLKDVSIQEIVVQAKDDPADLEKPRGKQDWQVAPHSIWYPRTTGIWQTVWLEVLPGVYIDKVNLSTNLERWEIALEAHVRGPLPSGARLAVSVRTGGELLAEDTYTFVPGALASSSVQQMHRRIALSDPGIDDFRNRLLWSPSMPTLLDVQFQLLDATGKVMDEVRSYTALRSLSVQGDRFVLNGRPLPLRLVLDQGYWPESGLTAPNEHAFVKDILLVKALGFNGVRKHQKVEDPRFLYWADHLGLLVWEEMPSAYRYTKFSVKRLTREWMEIVERDVNHPCIIAWVPFNESWGVPDLPDSPAQRDYVQALYHLTKTLDPTRPVIGNDGWESVATDIIGIHDYDAQPEHIAERYAVSQVDSRLFQFERPGGRLLRLGSSLPDRQPIVLTEFGGIALKKGEDGTWGYSTCRTPEEFLRRYVALLAAVRSLPTLAGFCYTQFTDTYQEANGLVYADRTPKVPIAEIAEATTGTRADPLNNFEQQWRERLMALQA